MGLKASWTIRAGVIPGQSMPEFFRQYFYTSEMDQQDTANNPRGSNPGYHSLLAKMRAEAMDYYVQVSMPQMNNWAEIVFLWL